MTQQSPEEHDLELYVAIAKHINKECGDRSSDGTQDPYAGFACDEAALQSAIAAPLQWMFGKPRYETSYERAAAFMVHLAKAHAFADGNKRTSLKLAIAYLSAQGFVVDMESPEKAADLVEWAVTAHDLSFDEIIKEVTAVFASWTRLP